MKKQTGFFGILAVLGAVGSLVGIMVITATQFGAYTDAVWPFLAGALAALIGSLSKSLAVSIRSAQRTKRVFLSYPHERASDALEIADVLRGIGVKVWFDADRVRPGDEIYAAIERAMEDTDVFVTVLSRVRRKSLTSEIAMALERGIKVVPVLLEDAEIPIELRGLKFVDLRERPEEGLQELVEFLA